jgi:hypothetical protein
MLAITSFIIRYRDEGATPGEYETAASEHVGDSRKRLAVTLVNASRLPGTNLLDEWIGDLPLIAEVVASQLAKITCPTGRQYIENRFQRQSASPGP